VIKRSEDKECSVCMTVYKLRDKVVFLGCKHHFHAACVKPWFDKAHVCPLCRFDINLNMHAAEVKEKYGDEGPPEEEEGDDYGNEDDYY